MRIKSLRLKDFRAFHKFEIIDLGKHENTNIVDNKNSIDIEIKFPDSNLTVFIGENGSGKTSILDALAILLTKIFNTAPNKSSQALISKRNSKFITGLSSYELKESDIYFEKDKNISVTKIELLLDNNENGLFNWILKGYKDGDNFIEATEEIELEKGHNTHYSLISSIRYNLERNHNYANLPIFCFYQTNSSIYEKDNNNKPKISLNKDFPSQFFAYRNSFSKDSYSFEEFIKWFRVNEEKENKTVKEKENLKFKEPALEVIREVLKEVSRIFELGLDSIRVDPNDSTLIILRKNHSKELHLSQLSAGEQRILFLFFDIAKRIYHANPGMFYDEYSKLENAKEILKRAEGIVIIDEVDLHLHPKWQPLVIPALTNTFKNIHFIVTTHSPFVMTSAPPNTCIFLENIEGKIEIKNDKPHTSGTEITRNLQLMGITSFRSYEIQEKVNQLWKLIKADNFETEEFLKLQKELSILLPADDRDIMLSKMELIKRKGKKENAKN